MNVNSTNLRPARVWRFGLGSLLLAAGTLLDQRIATAQTAVFNPNNVLANPAAAPPLQTQDQQSQPGEMDVFQAAGGVVGNSLPQIFRFGPVLFQPRADYGLMYGSGIQYTPGSPEATIIQTLSPGLRVDLGTHWALDYAPTFQFYSSDKFRDTVNQSFALTGGLEYEDWKLGLSQSAGYSSSPTVATGGQTDQSFYTTALTASRALTSQISANFGLNQAITLVPGMEDTYGWSTSDSLNYQFWPRLNVGISLGGGYTMVENNRLAGAANNENQTYEQAQVLVNWRATDKISFQLSGGLDDRQFNTAGAGDSLSPIFAATIQYQPIKATQISLAASRSVSSSALYQAAQETEITTVGLNLNQQLFRRFSLGFGVAYSESAYGTAVNAASAGAANRTDNQFFFTARLSHPLFKRGSWSVFYQYSDNRSSQGGYTFESNQTGFEIGYHF